MATELTSYIPIQEAARRYHIDQRLLTAAIESGTMRAVQVNGDLVVAIEDLNTMSVKQQIWKRVASLDGKPIGIEDAKLKYNLGMASIYNWIKRGYIRILNNQTGGGRGNQRTLNEADVAYISLVADERGRQPGKRIITREFVPPHLSA